MTDLYRKERYEVNRDVGDGEQGEDMVTYRTRFVPITIDVLAAAIGYGIDLQEAIDIVQQALAGRDGLRDTGKKLYDRQIANGVKPGVREEER